MKKKSIYRFRIELEEIEPLIWRTIEVPSTYTFWDLHVAIQDSMGWLDCHLHSFLIPPPKKGSPIVIGVPFDEYGEEVLPDWEIPLNEYFREPGDEARYEYDFGDGWIHRVLMEGILLAQEQKQYPNCDNGEGACPPEDCGGVPGYYHLLDVLADEHGPEYGDMSQWLKVHVKNYYPYDSKKFDPKSVKFWNPKKRWKMAFEGKR